ncbi:MAG: c-type cytochrome [Fidelibacterota bacterium]
MKRGFQELLAVGITLVGLAGLPLTIFSYNPSRSYDSLPVIHLTGVMKNGVWTDEEVNGINYWWKSFHPAVLRLQKDNEILLRLTSSDGTHSFYVPELGIGPIQIEAGHTVEITVQPDKIGEFTYYCLTVCGECHYYMRGRVIVTSDTLYKLSNDYSIDTYCTIHNPPENFDSFVAKGEYLYQSKGCITCHGENGAGGVYNPNYINEYVPPLNNLADKMKIYWKEDADIVIDLLTTNVDLNSQEDKSPIENYSRFLAQYHSIHKKILNGSSKLQKLNLELPDPPLTMPSWEEQLSEEDINSILAYLINLYPWDEYE